MMVKVFLTKCFALSQMWMERAWAEAIVNGNIENPAPRELALFDIQNVILRLIEAYEGLLHGT